MRATSVSHVSESCSSTASEVKRQSSKQRPFPYRGGLCRYADTEFKAVGSNPYFRDAKQRLRKTLVEDGPIRRTLKPNKKEKGNYGRRSLWRLEASGITNQRLERKPRINQRQLILPIGDS